MSLGDAGVQGVISASRAGTNAIGERSLREQFPPKGWLPMGPAAARARWIRLSPSETRASGELLPWLVSVDRMGQEASGRPDGSALAAWSVERQQVLTLAFP